MPWVLRAMNKKQTEWKNWCKKHQWEHRFKDWALSFEHHICKEKSRARCLFCVSLLPAIFVCLLLLLGSGKGNEALLLQAFQFNLVQFYIYFGLESSLCRCPFSFPSFSSITLLLVAFCCLCSVPYKDRKDYLAQACTCERLLGKCCTMSVSGCLEGSAFLKIFGCFWLPEGRLRCEVGSHHYLHTWNYLIYIK